MTKCLYSECSNSKRYANGYCGTHEAQRRAGKTLQPARSYVRRSAETCIVTNCLGLIATNEVCGGHAQVAWRMGIDVSELSRLYSGGCAICGSRKNLHIDHDHKCCATLPACGSCVRGALCASCNSRVGKMDKHPELYTRTLEYSTENVRLIVKAGKTVRNRKM